MRAFLLFFLLAGWGSCSGGLEIVRCDPGTPSLDAGAYVCPELDDAGADGGG